MTSHRIRTAIVVFAALLVVFNAGLTRYALDDNGRTGLDRGVTNWAIAHRDGVLTPTAVTVSALGGTLAMTALATLVCLGLSWRRRWSQAVLVAITGLGAGLLVRGGKSVIGRDRPPVEEHLVTVANQSYPSGHSLGSFVVVGIVAVVLIPNLRRTALRAVAATLAVIFVAAVGLSRIYLGVHWITDVLGGWCLGALWLLACLTVYRYLTRRKTRAPDTRLVDTHY
ncbi:phosphatase PAP2 family protein [Nocardia sp. NPDC023852]|uniref:phosphatase PAP2 family protein n=1 Tax=Nocardia sp. NPDC023852 TaxID=3154697 RepID=UPI0033D2C778